MTFDSQKRSTLKALTAATAALASTSTMAAPGMASAMQNTQGTNDAIAKQALNTDLVVSFSDKQSIGGVREVIVTNTSNKPVNLSLVYPSVVSTPEGQYDLNSLLTNGTRTFAPKQAVTLTIRATNKMPSEKRTPWMHPAESMISVRTHNPRINGGDPVTTTRTMFT